MGSYARSRGIVQLNDNYYCPVNTLDSNNIYQVFIFTKLDLSGEIVSQNMLHVPNTYLYPGYVGGVLKKTNDNNLIFAYHAEDPNGTGYSSFVKFDTSLKVLWKKDYTTENEWTLTMNCNLTNDNGYILAGSVLPVYGEYYDFLLLKTDSLGNEQWHQTYGTEWAEHGQNVIQTPDGGYLIGGFYWKPGYDHSLDAMVVKTDSLGNEQWTKYFGNPNIDDDMAFVAMADDGNYLVATVYGEWIHTVESRTGELVIYKIDTIGNVIDESFYSPKRRQLFLKNFIKTNYGYLATGFSYYDTLNLYNYCGWLYKINNDFDSVFRREYMHFNEEYAYNSLYDVTPTSDNGYVAIGRANEGFTQANMWVLKIDSMGCDTPGCATGTFVKELFPYVRDRGEELRIWPNPVREEFWVKLYAPPLVPPNGGNPTHIVVYNSQGVKIKEALVRKGEEAVKVNVRDWQRGIYYVRMIVEGRSLGSGKVVVE
jgi:hypothetical protein